MRHPASSLRAVPFRAVSIGALIATLLCVFYLSFASRAHERIHADAKKSTHECAITMFAAGACEDAADSPIYEAGPAPSFSPLFLFEGSFIFTASVGMSILEHAPPQNS
jgi:hypothetical protein